jgi:hypothetical protein
MFLEFYILIQAYKTNIYSLIYILITWVIYLKFVNIDCNVSIYYFNSVMNFQSEREVTKMITNEKYSLFLHVSFNTRNNVPM